MACIAAAAVAQIPAQNAAAATPPPPPPSPTVTGPSKIAIINIQQTIAETGEGKKLALALDARFAPKETEIQNTNKAIAALQKQLTDQGNTMSQQAKDDLNREIAAKQRDAQQSAQNAESDFQNAQAEMMNTVAGKMMPVLKKYAEEHGYTAVIDISMNWPQSPVLYYNPGTDITGDMIKLYDQAHPVAAAASKPGGPQ
ncbi:MAG: OmpH family outer membrane protein [Terriglobales bacterium]